MVGRHTRKSVARQAPTFTESAEPRTFSEYQEALHRSLEARPDIEPLAIAMALADVGRSIGDDDIVAGGYPVFSIASALLAALRENQRPFPIVATDDSPFLSDRGHAEELLKHANGVLSDESIQLIRAQRFHDPEAVDAHRRGMIWTLAENYIFQGEIRDRLPIALVLTGLSGFRNLPADPESTNALFLRQVGLSAWDYVLILVGLWAWAHGGCIMSLSTLIEESPRKEELTEAAGKVVASLARRVDRLRDFSDAGGFGMYSGRALASAVFQRWPLVQLNDSQFLVAAHPFLKLQVSSKFLTKALAFARATAPADQRARTGYSTFIGEKRLEPFVRELCEDWCPGRHFDEYQYVRGALSPDRIIFERHASGEVAVLLQLKAKLVLEATHFGAGAEALAKDLSSAMCETVYKSIRFLATAERAERRGGLLDATAALSRRVLQCRRFCLVGIVPELPPLLTMSDARQQLVENARSKLVPEDREWLDQNQGRIMWHVIGLDEFVTFLALPAAERSLFKRLAAYHRDQGPDRRFVEAGRMPMSFRNYLVRRYGQAKKSDIGLRKIFEHVFAEARRYFATGLESDRRTRHLQ